MFFRLLKAQPALGAVSAPGLALNSAPIGAKTVPQFASIYSAPSLGYALGGHQVLAAVRTLVSHSNTMSSEM